MQIANSQVGFSFCQMHSQLPINRGIRCQVIQFVSPLSCGRLPISNDKVYNYYILQTCIHCTLQNTIQYRQQWILFCTELYLPTILLQSIPDTSEHKAQLIIPLLKHDHTLQPTSLQVLKWIRFWSTGTYLHFSFQDPLIDPLFREKSY